MEELISVIVPVHNSERYLNQCIESIINQTYHNLEIILVDDCSTDNSAVICDHYAPQDVRIRVIHKEIKGGEGGARARNEGIAAATGEIFYFIDSDDYIEQDMLSQMYNRMGHDHSDCVVSSFHYINADGRELPWHTPRLTGYCVMPGKDAVGIFLTTLNIEGFSWNKLIRKDVMLDNQILFDETMNSFVDLFGMFRVILNSRLVSFYDAKPYNYRQHDISCVHTMSLRKLGNFRRAILQVVDLAKENDLEKESLFFYQYRMVLQLFDFIKDKKKYSRDIWKQFKNEYRWKDIMGYPLGSVFKVIFSYLKDDKLKVAIKFLWVWFFTCLLTSNSSR